MRTILLILACATFFCCRLQAQNRLQGWVYSAERQPLAEALVTAMQPGDTRQVLSSTRTDSAGVFTLTGLPEDILLEVAAFGYEGHIRQVRTADYRDKPLEVSLTYITLGEVTVTATGQPRMVREGNKVIIDQLDNSPHAKGNDMYAFMRFIPVLEVPMFTGNVTLTETGGGCAVLLVNGRKVNAPMESYLKNVHVKNIERIEVVAHPMGEYKVTGDCGVINLVLKKREDEGALFALSLNDSHDRVNSQDGMFTMNYTRNKTFISTGVYAYHLKDKKDTETDYRFYTDNRQNLQNQYNREKYILAGGYFNIDYELNKKHTIGLQANIGGADNDVSQTTNTQYGSIGLGRIDSIYQSGNETENPHKLTNVSGNLNYTFKADQKGSVFYADVDYMLSRPKERTYGTYNRMGGEGNILTTIQNMQENTSNVNAYGMWLRYIHVFNPETKLTTGLSYYAARSSYDNLYSTGEHGVWQTDDRFNSRLDFDDHTFSAYATVNRTWNPNLITTLSLRAEAYKANGEQRMTGETFSRNEFDLVPSLNVFYKAHKNHSFIFNISRRLSRPRYHMLDPSRRFITESSYSQGNPDLKSCSKWEGHMNYRFFRNYSLFVLYSYMKNLNTTLTRPDADGLLVTKPVNRGDSNFLMLSLQGNQSLFNNYLYLRASADMFYNKFFNHLSDMKPTEKICSWGASVRANVTISKTHNLTTEAEYSYSGESLGSEYSTPEHHSISWALSKRFNHSNLRIGLSKRLGSNRRFFEQTNYSYHYKSKSYFFFYASYSIIFGNTRTKSVRNRANSEMKGRIEKDTNH